MIIQTAEFVKSSETYEKCPDPLMPEYAFIGRSNVGKSSLINMLTQRKSLAKTSQTPGKTQLINHFLINDNWYLTDLPGYGYAKVSKVQRGQFQEMILDYLLERPNLICLYVLIDIRIPPQKIDLEFMEFCGNEGVPFSIIFTKADKLKKKNAIDTALKNYSKELLETWEELPKIFVSSAENALGRDEILGNIHALNQEIPHGTFSSKKIQ